MPDQDFPATTHSRDSRLTRHFSRSLFSSRPSMIRPARFAVAVLLVSTLAIAQNPNASQNAIPTEFNEATIAQLQADMASHKLSSEQLTRFYITRILALDQAG